MTTERKKRGLKKEFLLAAFKESNLEPIGLFVNTVHIQSVLGIDPGNLSKYLKEEFNVIRGGYIVVKIERDNTKPIMPNELLATALPLAQERKTKAILATFTADNLKNMTPEKLKAIQEILNK